MLTHPLPIAENWHLLQMSTHNTLHINEPTRITERSSSILDQFITNIPEFVETTAVDTPPLTNDHSTVSISLRFKISKMQPIERLIWQYKHADFEGLNYALQNVNWEICFGQPNVDFACSKWNEIFLNLARQYIPNKVVNIRTDDKPWYTSELRKLSRKKNSLHLKAKRRNSPADWNNFRMAEINILEKYVKLPVHIKPILH